LDEALDAPDSAGAVGGALDEPVSARAVGALDEPVSAGAVGALDEPVSADAVGAPVSKAISEEKEDGWLILKGNDINIIINPSNYLTFQFFLHYQYNNNLIIIVN
jgi:hypothetical protein